MITIAGEKADTSALSEEYKENSVESLTLDKMNESAFTYAYDYPEQLSFELNARSKVPEAALALKESSMTFAVFENARCNKDFWFKTDNGGFKLKSTVKPSEAISDIFENGEEYATECATAISIIYLKALLDTYGAENFDSLFPAILLMDWDVRERLLAEIAVPVKVADVFIGDRGYFKNPDVDPKLPQWQGENVIVMPEDMYYGHGIGYADADYIVSSLNGRRKANAKTSAYFMNEVSRPNFKKLADAVHKPATAMVWKPFPTGRVPRSSEMSGTAHWRFV